MTPTEIARRSDALYADGTCGMTRRVLCDMVAQRESDLEDARAENAKLRKLAAEMYPYAKTFLQEGLILGYIDSKSYDWFLQLREMGIEADE